VGYLSKTGKKLNIGTNYAMVDSNITKLAVLFVLVGAMMIVVPMSIGQVYAVTNGAAHLGSRSDTHGIFANVKGRLDAGRWIIHPRIYFNTIEWATAGPLPFGGNEKGQVDADVVLASPPGQSDQLIGHIAFFWSNPLRGPNTCNVIASGQVSGVCHITQGDSSANAVYRADVN